MRALLAIAAFSLVCIGVHAAADRLDDQIMAGVERIDTFIDGIVSGWSFTRPLADWIDTALIVKVSRGLALLWELIVSFFLAGTIFRHKEIHLGELRRALSSLTLKTVIRPTITLGFVLAGVVSINQIIHGATIGSTTATLGFKAADVFGTIFGVAGSLLVLATLGVQAVASTIVDRRREAFRVGGTYRTYADAAGIALCLWVGLYRTPAGALVRTTGGYVLGVRANVRPLLSYYSGGIERGRIDAALIVQVPYAPTPAEALGLGAKAAYESMPKDRQQALVVRLGMRTTDTEAFTRALKELGKSRKDSEAVLALFAGDTIAAFAQANAGKDDIEVLAAALPPGYEVEATAAGRTMSFARVYGFSWPLVTHAKITSPFGWRTHPVTGEQVFHKGVDLGVPSGTEVRAAGPGVVERSSEDDFNGNIVVIQHGQGVRTFYLHNSERFVGRGQTVVAGQPIARSGQTGVATGPHLHYQLEIGAIPHDPTAFRKQ